MQAWAVSKDKTIDNLSKGTSVGDKRVDNLNIDMANTNGGVNDPSTVDGDVEANDLAI